jgi:predicted esterase
MEASEKSIKTTKTARYYQLGECTPQTKRIWIVLHGYGQLASYFIKHFEPLADAETCIVAPEGLSRFYLDGKWDRVGATWMTKEDRLHEIQDYVEYLDKMLESLIAELAHKPEVILLAFSQGTATAWRWLMKGNVQPSQFVMWAGGPATDAMDKARERFAHCGLHFVLGDTDEYIRLADAEQQLLPLRQLKPDLKLWTFVGNHRMDAEVLHALNASWA